MKDSTHFDQFVDSTEQFLDAFIDHGSDEELFISGYLHGHFSLAVSQSMQQSQRNVDFLKQSVEASLVQAFENDELEVSDQHKVLSLWRKLAP